MEGLLLAVPAALMGSNLSKVLWLYTTKFERISLKTRTPNLLVPPRASALAPARGLACALALSAHFPSGGMQGMYWSGRVRKFPKRLIRGMIYLYMALGTTTIQVISKQRVSDHGEVLTAEREVTAMLDLVRHETERIDSRFLEPACGTGNFLVPILEKKLEMIKKRYAKSQVEFERYAVIAAGSIYGIDILDDNVQKCRDRLFMVFDTVYSSLYKQKSKDSCRDSARFIFERNILLGDALTLKTISKESEPIVFSEWVLVQGSMIKRRDYTFAELLHDHTKTPTIFSQVIISDLGEPQFHPNPIKEYQLCHVLELAHENTN